MLSILASRVYSKSKTTFAQHKVQCDMSLHHHVQSFSFKLEVAHLFCDSSSVKLMQRLSELV